MTIFNVFIIKNGALLVKSSCNSGFKKDFHLISGFLSAIQSFSKELTGSSMRSLNFKDSVLHFSVDQKIPDLIYVIATDQEYYIKQINCKILKISTLFKEDYFEELLNFNGNIEPYESFSQKLEEMEITKKFCGDPENCRNCSYRHKQIYLKFKTKKNHNILNNSKKWLRKIVEELPDVVSALLLDLDGYILTEYTKEYINAQQINAILRSFDPTLRVIKNNSSNKCESGTINVNDFQLYYIKLGGLIPTTLIVLADLYCDFERYIPFILLIAEIISSILNNQEYFEIRPFLTKENKLGVKILNDRQQKNNSIINLFFVGDPKCGKSSILNKVLNGEINKHYRPTIGVSILKQTYRVYDVSHLIFLFYEIGGLHSFAKARKSYFRIKTADIIFIVFDLENPNTLENVNDWIEEIIFYTNKQLEDIVLIGNKKDIYEDNPLFREKITHIIDHYNLTYIKTSAFTGEGIDLIMNYITSKIDFNWNNKKQLSN